MAVSNMALALMALSNKAKKSDGRLALTLPPLQVADVKFMTTNEADRYHI